MKTKKFLVLALLTILTLVVSACAPAAGVPGAAPAAAPAAGEEAAVSGDEYSTPHPILSDLNVRKAIAHCLDRDALIASVYPYVEDPEELRMDSWAPKTSWPYQGPYDFPDYDLAAGQALLEEAGWTLGEDVVRTNANGDRLSLKLTTTNAAFRQTWTAVAIQQLAECGIEIIPTYAPASWWFGDTTGLARRDFELGAYAWVGQSEPAGRSLYACDQIPTPSNNWEGQNYMGWCNETASNAVIRATNTLLREDRIAAYDIVQQEFAKDVVSIPVFARAEAEAWSTNLEGPDPDPTEYTTWNLPEWRLTDGGDTIVIGMTQEPDSLWAAVSTMAASALVRKALGETGGGDNPRDYFQREYDFQPWLQTQLSTIENGLATNNDLEVAAGDTVYDVSGQPVTLEAGTVIFDSEGNEVEYDGTSPLTMKQQVVTYEFQDYTWSDGEPGKNADFELGYKIDCDPSGGAAGYVNCETIESVEFAPDALEHTITYLPGVQSPTYFLPIIGPYPSHQVLSDGRNLADVPAAEWATLPEIAERPLSWGPYMVTEWIKGQSITLAANPHWTGEPVVTPNVIFVIVADTNQAVAQLLNGDVDFLDDSTLGAGAEVQTVIDAAEGGAPVQYEIAGAPTWEHIDMNLYTK